MKGSVEDKVHELLSDRLEKINSIFGQIPDILEDVWVDIALNRINDAKKLLMQYLRDIRLRLDMIK